jgi:hypothetical protein
MTERVFHRREDARRGDGEAERDEAARSPAPQDLFAQVVGPRIMGEDGFGKA